MNLEQMNQDVWKQIASYMDESTLENLSKTSLWSDLLSPVIDQYFWFLKAQRLVDIDLEWEKNKTENWHQVYNILSDISKKIPPFSPEGSLAKPENGYNLLAVKILIRLGYNPAAYGLTSLELASRFGSPEAVQLLLQGEMRGRASRGSLFEPLDIASELGRLDIIKVLLSDSRVRGREDAIHSALLSATDANQLEAVKLLLPLVDKSWIREAVRESNKGHADILRFLLLEQRVIEPWYNLLYTAVEKDYIDSVRVHLEDGRLIIPMCAGAALEYACKYGRSEILKLLLQDERIILNIAWDDGRLLSIAVEEGNSSTVSVLLEDERVDKNGSTVAVELVKREELSNKMVEALIRGKNTDIHNLPNYLLKYAVDHTSEYTADSMEGYTLLSGRRITLQDLKKKNESFIILQELKEKDELFYDILVQEIILKRRDLEYYLGWILKQLDKRPAETKKLFSSAARSLLNGTSVHSSPRFTAYRGFFLLAVSDDAKIILNTLRHEGATQEGINLAGGLIGAYLGKKKIT